MALNPVASDGQRSRQGVSSSRVADRREVTQTWPSRESYLCAAAADNDSS